MSPTSMEGHQQQWSCGWSTCVPPTMWLVHTTATLQRVASAFISRATPCIKDCHASPVDTPQALLSHAHNEC